MPWPLLKAATGWRVVDFISDLHLHAGEPDNFAAWQAYLRRTTAQAVFILGDLFDVWVGDDALDAPDADSFDARCAAVLREASSRHALFFMRGNRDFLVGEAFARACGMQLLHDPTVLEFGGRRWLLSHGDALCLDDTDYMQFRALVRGGAWQRSFLAQPLAERQSVARDLRARSEARKQSMTGWVDPDTAAVAQWLATAEAAALIHGHTHRPADHALQDGRMRHVLSDWDGGASTPRAQVLRLTADGRGPVRVGRLPAASA